MFALIKTISRRNALVKKNFLRIFLLLSPRHFDIFLSVLLQSGIRSSFRSSTLYNFVLQACYFYPLILPEITECDVCWLYKQCQCPYLFLNFQSRELQRVNASCDETQQFNRKYSQYGICNGRSRSV